MYAYCGNNPIMYIDIFGMFPILAAIVLGVGLVVGAVAGGIVKHNEAKQTGATGSELFWETTKGVLLGAVLGVAGAGLLLTTMMIIPGVISGGAATAWLGGATISQTAAIGILAYNILPLIVAPFLAIEIEPISWGEKPYKPYTPNNK